jgi:hypothetical protein
MHSRLQVLFVGLIASLSAWSQVAINHGSTTIPTRLDTALCSASTFSLTADAATPTGTTYQWSLTGYSGSAVTLTNSTQQTVTVATTQPSVLESVTLTLTATNSSSGSSTKTVNLILFPAINFNLNSYCSNRPNVPLTATPVGGVYSSSTSGLVQQNGSTFSLNLGSITTTGNYPVSYTISHTGPSNIVRTCTRTEIATITHIPDALLSSNTVSFCQGSGAATLSGGSPSGGTYFVSGYPNGVSGGQLIPGNLPLGTVNLGYFITNGTCSDTAIQQIQITGTNATLSVLHYASTSAGTPITSSQFNGLPTYKYCSNTSPLTFGLSIGNFSSFTSYSINWGNGQTSTGTPSSSPITQTYTAAGVYLVTLNTTDAAGCTSTKLFNLYFGTNPSAGLSFNGNTTGCIPADSTGVSFDFEINNWQSDPIGILYKFSLNSSSIPVVTIPSPLVSTTTGVTAHPNLRYNSATGVLTYRFRFTQSSCGLSFNQNNTTISNVYGFYLAKESPCGTSYASIGPIDISTMPVAAVTAPSSICAGNTATFTDASTGGQVVILFMQQC